jgi:putative aldouronate transport system substrate-binding protein
VKKGRKFFNVLLVLLLSFTAILSACSNNAAPSQTDETAAEVSSETDSTETENSAKTTETSDTAATAPDTSKEVKLKVILMGDKAPDADKVWAKVNEMLKQDLNATIEPKFIPWTDYETKYNLLVSSGEEYDLIYVANWLNFTEYARKGAYLEIPEEILKTYAPKTAAYPEEVIKAGKIDGRLYGVPANKENFFGLAYVVRGDLMKKYGITEIKGLDDFGNYLDAVTQNEKNLIPYNVGSGDAWMLWAVYQIANGWHWVYGGTRSSIDINDPEVQIFNPAFTDKAVAHYKNMKEWRQKGFWSKNALVNKTVAIDAFKNGTSASAIANLGNANQAYLELKQSHPEWDVQVFNAYPGVPTVKDSYISNGIAVGPRSKNPERALMALDLLKNDPRYFNLTSYGIEGEHYTVNGEGKLVVTQDSKYPPVGFGWDNQNLEKPLADEMPQYQEIMNEYKANSKPEPLADFNMDAKDVSDITAGVEDIYQQYAVPMELGFTDDVEKSVTELRGKYTNIGMEKLLQEAQKQIDAYLAASK